MGAKGAAGSRAVHSPRALPDHAHRVLLDGEFWRTIPGYAEVDSATFLDHRFQAKHSVSGIPQLRALLGRVDDAFFDDASRGLQRAPMSVRLSPYVIALIDWAKADTDPLRRQFLPLASEQLPEHPMTQLDSLAERAHSPLPGVTHRYSDRVLLVTQDRCPVYCRYCTRSYAVGLDVESVRKQRISAQRQRWQRAFEYIREHEVVEDVLISGGDAYSLRPDQLRLIGDQLLAIPHLRRIRLATKGPVVVPMKLLTDDAWTQALIDIAQRGRALHKEVVVHTHFNHPREITAITKRASERLFEAGITTRNQGVVLRGVNDDADTLRLLVKRLGHINVQPMYMFQHDLVRGVEDLRTPLSTSVELEKQVRGFTAGYNTPTFAVDLPGGGGKRDVHAFEHYDRDSGISVYRSPNIDDEARFLYFDPIDTLAQQAQRAWESEEGRRAMIARAMCS